MTDPFDLERAAASILKASDLIRAHGLPAGRGRFDAGESDGLFEGDVPAGLTLAGSRSLLVQGSLRGEAAHPCAIEVAGDAVVTGDVHGARVQCRNLHVGGDLRGSLVCAAGNVAVAADVADARLSLGDYQARRHRIEELRTQTGRLQEEGAAADRRIAQEERRLYRACQATRIPLDFGVSRLVTQEHNRIRVSLSVLYSALGRQPTPALAPAINEFFAKGIIGYLARANRKYIADNPAREKVFMQLLRQLRSLVMGVFERDQQVAAARARQAELDALLAELREQRPTLCIGGSLRPESQVEFVVPRIQRLEGGEINFVHQTPRLQARRGPRPGVLHLELVDAEGEPSARDVDGTQLQRTALSVLGGGVAWEPLRTDAP
ncbi:MAG: hypothetical protein AB1505_23835 [Candidatus Latescibacterota bacterium]